MPGFASFADRNNLAGLDAVWKEEGFHFDYVRKRYVIKRRGQGGAAISSDFRDFFTWTQAGTAGSYVDENGIVILNPPANTPKYEFDPSTRQPLGLTVEAVTTNTFLQSADFTTTWTTTNATVTGNTTTAPDNSSDADTLTEDIGVGVIHTVQQNVTTSASMQNFSVWAKANGRNWIYIELPATAFTAVQRVWFNVSTGVVGTTSGSLVRASYIQAFPNGWYRCMVSAGNGTAAVAADIVIGLASADNTTTYTGLGIAGVFLWGAQYTKDATTAGNFANYVPTTTVAVTNPATVNSRATLLGEVSQAQGTFLFEGMIRGVTIFPTGSLSLFSSVSTFNDSAGTFSSIADGSFSASAQMPNTVPNQFYRTAASYGPLGLVVAGFVRSTAWGGMRVEDYLGSGNGTAEFDQTFYSSATPTICMIGGSSGSSTPTRPQFVKEAHYIPRQMAYPELMSWVQRLIVN